MSKDTFIIDALRFHPKARDIFLKHGMGCIGCMGSTRETIETGAKMHDINLDALLEELNMLITDH